MTDTQRYAVMFGPTAAVVAKSLIDAWQFAKLRRRMDAFIERVDVWLVESKF